MPSDKKSPPKFKVGVRRNLHETSRFLRIDTKRDLGVFLDGVHVYLHDPLIAKRDPAVGIRPIEIKWEPRLANGPTSARFVVVDYNGDTGVLLEPAKWKNHISKHRYEGPKGELLDADHCDLPQFHQVNVWAVAQSVLDMFEAPQALGRPIPWSFGDGRLILVPHAGYDANAYYDRHSQSLQFYYYGDENDPKYTCLSHDIIAHEMGHAVLDGIRPFYYNFTSLQTGAFHESIADLSAIVSAILNNDIRGREVEDTGGDLTKENAIALLAEEFGEEVLEQSSLRNALKKIDMEEAAEFVTPHALSQVLTGAMFEILANFGNIYLERERHRKRKTSPLQALWWAADRFRRLVFQPLDYCPPVDIQFADYARAVLSNFLIHEPYDSPRRDRYFSMMLSIFRDRGILGRGDFSPLERPSLDIYHDIARIGRSRTAAYYFLNDNRSKLKIPAKANLEVIDLYDTEKYGRNAMRLPREIVIQYVWREEVALKKANIGQRGRAAELLCGGTLVLDGRGNILALARKDGTERAEGKLRASSLQEHIASLASFGLRGEDEAAEVYGPWSPAVIGDSRDGLLRLEMAPHLRSPLPMVKADEDEDWSEMRWTSNY